MMENLDRPHPDELLKAVKKEELLQKQGHLKIFLGMAAGVGKTYAMLAEAQELRRAGIHPVVGIVETHGRADTASLLKDLDRIPEKIVRYKDNDFRELDVDEILRQKPEIVLVDELAHTNVPGSRHAKRWEDVLELLENGIDVYTTLNVQHIESLNDTIKSITGIAVKETVPDLVIENAASIQMIDLAPDELLQRLKEGKVYLGDQAHIAALNFFQKDKLTALREIVLRYAAEKIDRELYNTLFTNEQTITWKPREKYLVAISYSPLSQKNIRTTRRLAAMMNAPWVAVYVNNGRLLSEEEEKQLNKNLKLARDLGAEIVTISDPDVVEGIKRVAKQKRATQLIVGRSPKSSFWKIFQPPPLFEALTSACSDIDVHVVRQDGITASYRKKFMAFSCKGSFQPYLWVLLIIVPFIGLNSFLLPYLGYKIIGTLFLLAILALSLFFTKGPILFTSLLLALSWDVLFIPPRGRLGIASEEDAIVLILYLLTGLITGILVDRMRESREMLIQNEESIRSLYEIARQIALLPLDSQLLLSIQELVGKRLKGTCQICLKQKDGWLDLQKTTLLADQEQEQNAACWAFDHAAEAGWSTDVLPSSHYLYTPLKGFNTVEGVLVFSPQFDRSPSMEEKNFLHTVCHLLGARLERTFLTEEKKQRERIEQVERMQKSILERLAREFEQPQSMLKKALTHTREEIETTEQKVGLKALVQAQHAFESLVKILSSISVMAQLSEGLVPLNIQPQDINELIEESCESVQHALKSHQIKRVVPQHFPPILLDPYLIHIVLYHLLMNAISYSPPSSTIEIEVKIVDHFFVLSILDEGKGIPESELERIFDGFYRLPSATSPGAGLGLTIAKTITEMHQGRIIAENAKEKGARFSLFLPLNIQ